MGRSRRPPGAGPAAGGAGAKHDGEPVPRANQPRKGDRGAGQALQGTPTGPSNRRRAPLVLAASDRLDLGRSVLDAAAGPEEVDLRSWLQQVTSVPHHKQRFLGWAPKHKKLADSDETRLCELELGAPRARYAERRSDVSNQRAAFTSLLRQQRHDDRGTRSSVG